MSTIKVGNTEPGILGLFKFKPELAKLIAQLADTALHSNTLEPGHKDLIFATAAWASGSKFFAGVHSECAKLQVQNQYLVEAIRVAGVCSTHKEFPQLHELLHIAVSVASTSGDLLSKQVEKDVEFARNVGISDEDIHSAVIIASFAVMVGRYVDALCMPTPDPNSSFYKELAIKVVSEGYSSLLR